MNETMRDTKRELWTTSAGHTFAGSGHGENNKGVAILIHKKWSKHLIRFEAIDDRLAYVDMFIKNNERIRIVSAYFPHSGYADKHIQKMYDLLSQIKEEAKKKKMFVVIGGDFNAQVGDRTEDDDCKAIGPFALPGENSRGQWLKNWTAKEKLVITNTFYRKQFENMYTYTSPQKKKRQLDYILVCRPYWKRVRNVAASKDIDLGSDHQSVRLDSVIPTSHCKVRTPRKTQNLQSTKAHHSEWKLVDGCSYQRNLTQRLEDLVLDMHLDERRKQIEETMREAAAGSKQSSQPTADNERQESLEKLIQERRATPNSDTSQRSRISKRIQKEIKAMKRLERHAKIETILSEYKDLKKISGIKSRRSKVLIVEMTGKDGTIETSRQGIADIFADFYEGLYSATRPENDNNDHHDKDNANDNTDTKDNNDRTATDNDSDRHGDDDSTNHRDDNEHGETTDASNTTHNETNNENNAANRHKDNDNINDDNDKAANKTAAQYQISRTQSCAKPSINSRKERPKIPQEL